MCALPDPGQGRGQSQIAVVTRVALAYHLVSWLESISEIAKGAVWGAGEQVYPVARCNQRDRTDPILSANTERADNFQPALCCPCHISHPFYFSPTFRKNTTPSTTFGR